MAGKRLFVMQCARCHGIAGNGGTGPALARPVLRYATDDAAFFSIVQNGIPGTGMPGIWMLTDPEVAQVIKYVRSLAAQNNEPLSGSPDRGRLVFQQAGCATCHIVNGEGGSLGPDLTEVGARRGTGFLRQAVSHPGTVKSLDQAGYINYLVVNVVTRDGREVRGARINEDGFTIQIRDENNVIHSFRKQALRRLDREADASLMPGFEQGLAEGELEDLVAYLAGLRGEL